MPQEREVRLLRLGRKGKGKVGRAWRRRSLMGLGSGLVRRVRVWGFGRETGLGDFDGDFRATALGLHWLHGMVDTVRDEMIM